ncbi:MAG: hypothetical protein CVT48_02155 [Thermoplasmata archaeon HGW-Thermoplasmata-1]|nr:MAG: hypothetical protein CVT48_02155 [Thermoplasmata archaeon HGW-Thermoplasmata-1]
MPLFGTGIAKLDELLGGGVPENSILAYSSAVGLESDVFLLHMIYEQLGRGRTCIVYSNVKSPSSLISDMKDYGFDVGGYQNNLVFIDAYSSLMGFGKSAEYTVKNPSDFMEVLSMLEEAVDKEKKPALFIASMNTMLDSVGEEAFVGKYYQLSRIMKKAAITSALYVEWGYSPEVSRRITQADCLILLRSSEIRLALGHYLKIQKAGWLKKKKDGGMTYRVAKPGGVIPYIPKLLVSGPYEAGKSTFVRTASSKSVSVDRFGTTIALDHGHYEGAGMSAELFGTPGQPRFDPLLVRIAGSALGAIIVVDSTMPETFERAKQMIKMVRSAGSPIVVAANKQDSKGAMKAEDVADALGLGEAVPVVACSAIDKKSTNRVIEILIKMVLSAPGFPETADETACAEGKSTDKQQEVASR